MSNPSYLSKTIKTINRRILTGLLVVIPLYFTYVAVRFIFLMIDGFSQPIVRRAIGTPMPGLGFVLTLALLYLLGLVAANVIGKSLLGWIEGLLFKLPIIKSIYGAVKQVVQTISIPDRENIRRVITFEYPRKGLRTIGFVTHSSTDQAGRKLVHVFVPTTPNPTSGFLIFVPEEDVEDADLTIDEAFKMVVSGGILTKKDVKENSSRKKVS